MRCLKGSLAFLGEFEMDYALFIIRLGMASYTEYDLEGLVSLIRYLHWRGTR